MGTLFHPFPKGTPPETVKSFICSSVITETSSSVCLQWFSSMLQQLRCLTLTLETITHSYTQSKNCGQTHTVEMFITLCCLRQTTHRIDLFRSEMSCFVRIKPPHENRTFQQRPLLPEPWTFSAAGSEKLFFIQIHSTIIYTGYDDWHFQHLKKTCHS